LGVIPSTFIRSKNKPILIHFDISDITINGLYKVKPMVENNRLYTVYVKVKYHVNNFFKAGNQFGWAFKNYTSINNLYEVVDKRLQDYFEYYKLTDEDIVYVQIILRELETKLLSEFKLDSIENNHNKRETIETKRNLIIPISISEKYLGPALNTTVDDNYVTDIDVVINNEKVNFLDIMRDKAKVLRGAHKDKITHFDKGFKFYLLKNNVSYVLGIHETDKNNVEKIRYSLDGVLINRVVDSLHNNVLTRKSNEKTITFNDNYEIISISQKIKLMPIDKPKSTNLSFISNPNIGVIDTETYTARYDINKIYALGFRTVLSNEPVMYYIGDDLNSDKIVLDMVDELLRPKYNKISFYCHNLSGYDIVFILKILYTFNDQNIDKYKISCILRNDKIIKVTISKGKNSFSIMDSYTMLSNSLEKLSESFEVTTKKTTFPYTFSVEKNIFFYKGNTPDYVYYESITKKDYDSMRTDN
jgi:hypothetical protein